jgi:hypothetical protein
MFRRPKTVKLALMVTTGAILTQLGPCTIMAAQTGVASVAPSLIDSNGRFLGIFNVCGRANVIPVDDNGNPTAGVLYSEDDLFYGCPATLGGP